MGSSATSCARWIRAAAGGDAATVRVAIPDPSGRLRVIACEGPSDGSGRLRSRRRRNAFRTRQAVHLPIPGAIGVSLGIFPLVHDGEALGVVEVLAPTAAIEGRHEVLQALVGQSSIVLTSARLRTEAERALAGMSALLRLASELLWAKTATDVVRVTVNVCHEHFGAPIAGLLPDRDGWGWFLASSEGFGSRRRSMLRTSLRSSTDEPSSRRLRLPSVRLRFREVTGSSDVIAVRAGAAVLLLGDAPNGHGDFLDGVCSLVEGILPRLGLDRVRSSRGRPTELGIAWTAHELKGPLVGARAALELATETATGEEGRELLRRTNEELGKLTELIDPLLRWSTGADTLSRQRVDLVDVTRQAIASSSLGSDPDRLLLEAPEQLFVRGDPRHLRSAIGNVVRNALTYSRAGTPVLVGVELENRSARVIVRDQGPVIPPGERVSIFEPFQRGRNDGEARPGSGLGLFIARRVLEAHGGSISLRPSRSGVTFVLALPAERWQLSAS